MNPSAMPPRVTTLILSPNTLPPRRTPRLQTLVVPTTQNLDPRIAAHIHRLNPTTTVLRELDLSLRARNGLRDRTNTSQDRQTARPGTRIEIHRRIAPTKPTKARLTLNTRQQLPLIPQLRPRRPLRRRNRHTRRLQAATRPSYATGSSPGDTSHDFPSTDGAGASERTKGSTDHSPGIAPDG